jgi:RNA polymerase sigma-70 factor (ECF subfamily)
MHVVTSRASGGRPARRRASTHGCLSEATLLKRARRKDVAAFEELVRRTESKLYQVALRYVRNESDAQEILQNAYLSAWRSLPTFQGRAQFACWMHRIIVNASLMLLRTRNRHPEIAIHDVEPDELNEALGQAAHYPKALNEGTQSPDEEYQCAELRRSIELAVNALPDSLRSTFVLRDVKEMSTNDAAGELGASIPAIKTRLYRARRVLRQSLGNYVAG